ncbi:MAG: efflux RND transporter periplasmic adaptor subunit [Deltaproteobacteria bacterium]|nr:efflux RND transporter periplasmic adaptor subunit [Deltaproteobacteria bacterium]NIS76697.1 efflux RND transporter periplasmic adaptor subunit [Deltaproteobacteria bacterium]
MSRKIVIALAIFIVFVVGLGGGYFFTVKFLHRSPHVETMDTTMGGTKEAKAEEQLYTCPMHPFIITEEPGSCPICGMTLVAVKGGGEGMEDENAIRIDPVVRQNMGVRTGVAKRGQLKKIIRTVGMVTYDETKISTVNTKIAGWIENLFVDKTGQFVKAGEPLLEIYSPELVSAQKELLIAARHYEEVKTSPYEEVVERAETLIEASKDRLRLWDITDKELLALERSGNVKKTLTIYSPNSGVVIGKKAFLGTHVMPGAELFRVADISNVWIDADIYEFELSWVKTGQRANVILDYIPGKTFTGKVSYIYPYLEAETKTIKVRIEMPNPRFFLKPDMYAHVELESKLGDQALLIPSEAVLRTGVKNIVFVEKTEGKFVPRNVTLGVETGNGTVQILEGIEENEKIVLSGQFMLDSESSIREAIRKMTAGGGEGSPKGKEHLGH